MTVEETKDALGRRALAACVLILVCAFLLAGCGGDRQDKDAPSGTWNVKVVKWNFPRKQPLGRPVNFTLLVRNDDQRDIPQLIVTVHGLKTVVKQGGAATTTRPIWLPNDVKYGIVTPYNSTLATSYNLGPVPAGRLKTFVLPLTPLRRGAHRVSYSLSGDLFGEAKLVTADGKPAAETRVVAIDPTPDFDESIFED